MMDQYPVAIIGAGPVGLAAAAHLLQRGEKPLVLERADQVGGNIAAWAHVRMFSPWSYTLDKASVALLEGSGNWQAPDADALPTGAEMIERYLQPLAELPQMRQHIQFHTEVLAISRDGIDKMKDAQRADAPFVLVLRDTHSGEERHIKARAVIDASGTWANPNPLGSGGLASPGEKASAQHIFYGIPDVKGSHRDRYANKRVMVVGSGHSAINALLDLADLQRSAPQTRIIWALRKAPDQTFGGGDSDALSARGALGERMKALVESGLLQIESPFRITQLKPDAGGLQVTGETAEGTRSLLADEIITATGSRPDLSMLRELRLSLDPSLESSATLGPLIDPNVHSCGTVPPHGEAELRHPEKDFYIVGMKSYGRAPTFLLATGYEQVRSVVAALAGDWDAARDVQLDLPETGVCSVPYDSPVGGACCAPARVNVDSISLNSISIS